MDKQDTKLIEQVERLEKLVKALTVRVTAAEAENKRLRSKIIRTETNVGSLSQTLQRIQRRG